MKMLMILLFTIKSRLSDENAFLIVWTTMPFTIVTDEMVAVNPDANYVYVSVDNEKWIIGENRLLELMKESSGWGIRS